MGTNCHIWSRCLNLSCYFQVTAEHPEIRGRDIIREVAARWHNLSPEERQKYDDRAQEIREQDTGPQPTNIAAGPTPEPVTDGRKLKNSFWYFCRANRAEFRSALYFLSKNQLTREIKDHWDKLPAEEKQKYEKHARPISNERVEVIDFVLSTDI